MTQREEFEAWASKNCYILELDESGDYERDITFSAYEGFKAAKAQVVPKWIPVSERLPDSDDEVLVYPFPDNSYGIRLGTYHPYEGKLKGKWTYEEERHSYYEQVEINNVTHWMPLPSAPEQNK